MKRLDFTGRLRAGALAMSIVAFAAASPSAGLATGTPAITLQAAGESLAAVLKKISAAFHVSIGSAPGLSGRVTVMLEGASLEDAMRAVTEPLGYSFRRFGSVIVVMKGPASGAVPSASASPALTAVAQVNTMGPQPAPLLLAPGQDRPAIAQPGNLGPTVLTSNGTNVQVVSLRAAVPAAGGAASTNASDIANAVAQALGSSTPTLRITIPVNTTQMILSGSPEDLRLARSLIEQLDVAQKLVVLDTQIVEIDETAARNLGLSLTPPFLSTTYSEVVPTPQPGTSSPPPFLGLLPFTRTPLTAGVTLNLLIERGNARVLSNPRITTISGRTATIRSGDNISILTTAGGSAGTVATTQLQTFQTGVSLDITPVVNSGDFISVTLHPTVNSLSGFQNGIPQISTRDTQTTVGMQAGQTLVIGGLIQENTQNDETKIPLLGDLPVVGKLFRNKTYNKTRNELIITVTPHIVDPGSTAFVPTAAIPKLPLSPRLPTAAPAAASSLTTPRPSEQTFQAVPGGQRGAESGGAAQVTTPMPSLQGAANGRTGRPQATPSAFANANVFTFGQAPVSTFAAPGDPPQIFFVRFAPTVVKSGTPISAAAITTSNVSKVTIGYGGFSTQLKQTQPGFWQGAFGFNVVGVPPGQDRVNLTLTASKIDGTQATTTIPVNIPQQ